MSEYTSYYVVKNTTPEEAKDILVKGGIESALILDDRIMDDHHWLVFSVPTYLPVDNPQNHSTILTQILEESRNYSSDGSLNEKSVELWKKFLSISSNSPSTEPKKQQDVFSLFDICVHIFIDEGSISWGMVAQRRGIRFTVSMSPSQKILSFSSTDIEKLVYIFDVADDLSSRFSDDLKSVLNIVDFLRLVGIPYHELLDENQFMHIGVLMSSEL